MVAVVEEDGVEWLSGWRGSGLLGVHDLLAISFAVVGWDEGGRGWEDHLCWVRCLSPACFALL